MTSLSALASKDTTMPSPPSELAVVRLSASGLESHAQSNGGTTSTSFETLITIPEDGHRGFANQPSGPSRRVRRARELPALNARYRRHKRRSGGRTLTLDEYGEVKRVTMCANFTSACGRTL